MLILICNYIAICILSTLKLSFVDIVIPFESNIESNVLESVHQKRVKDYFPYKTIVSQRVLSEHRLRIF